MLRHASPVCPGSMPTLSSAAWTQWLYVQPPSPRAGYAPRSRTEAARCVGFRRGRVSTVIHHRGGRRRRPVRRTRERRRRAPQRSDGQAGEPERPVSLIQAASSEKLRPGSPKPGDMSSRGPRRWAQWAYVQPLRPRWGMSHRGGRWSRGDMSSRGPRAWAQWAYVQPLRAERGMSSWGSGSRGRPSPVVDPAHGHNGPMSSRCGQRGACQAGRV